MEIQLLRGNRYIEPESVASATYCTRDIGIGIESVETLLSDPAFFLNRSRVGATQLDHRQIGV
jgi:hypothetical protein